MENHNSVRSAVHDGITDMEPTLLRCDRMRSAAYAKSQNRFACVPFTFLLLLMSLTARIILFHPPPSYARGFP